jgi:TonB family protein
MESLLTTVATNSVTAALLALAAAVIARYTRRPTLWFALWLVVLLRLLAPPLFDIAVPIPDFGTAAANDRPAAVAVGGGALAIDDARASIDSVMVLLAIWAAGAMVVIGFAIAQTAHLRQILASSARARTTVEERAGILSERLGLRRAPPTVEVDDRVPPMLWAFLGSVRLILPTALLDRLGADGIDTLLAHELAHLSRRDHWVRHIELAALALFWWNPIAWWAALRLRRAQELCCDDRVAELLPGKRRAYADTLVETARFLSGRRLPLGSPARAMADLTQMKGRIRMIMKDTPSRKLSLPTRLAASGILLTVLAVTPILTAGPDTPEFTGEPINLELRDADINDVLATLSRIADKEILIEPGLDARITVTIKDVPWDQALSMILDKHGLGWKQRGNQIIVRQESAPEPPASPAPPAPSSPPAIAASPAPPVDVKTWTVHEYVEGGTITKPVAREKLPPTYPPEMRKEGLSGQVVAELVIDVDGMVRGVEIVESPAAEFSAAATEALEQWTFEPATKNGKPVAVKFTVTMMFRLD